MKALAIILSAVLPVATSPRVFMEAGPLGISREGYNLIIKHEVGGGASYYNRYLKRPSWPGGASGVTIGIGYDLGYNSRSRIAQDWQGISASTLARLQSCAGVKGSSAKRKLNGVRSVVIPWDLAKRVYETRTMPRFGALVERAYPGTATLHPHIQGAMLSWGFNRGTGISLSSSRDREKRAIRAAIPSHVERLPAQFRSSKRLWYGRGLDGLISRREDEAVLIETSL